MMLLAPALFSMTTGWPSLSCSFWLTSRAVMSVNPPGVYGTITLIGREGHDWASAGAAISSVAAAASAAANRRRAMLFLFIWPPSQVGRPFSGRQSRRRQVKTS